MDENNVIEMEKMKRWMLTIYPGSTHCSAILLASMMKGKEPKNLCIRNKQICNKNKGIPSLEIHEVDSEKGGWYSYQLVAKIPLLKKDMDEDMIDSIDIIKNDQIRCLKEYQNRAELFINNILK